MVLEQAIGGVHSRYLPVRQQKRIQDRGPSLESGGTFARRGCLTAVL